MAAKRKMSLQKLDVKALRRRLRTVGVRLI